VQHSTLSNFRRTVESIANLPTLPTVLERITRLLQNPRTSAEEVGRAITTDQSLSAKVLRLVNSAFYGFPGRIGTITHAIVILGFATIKNIVLTASIFDAFKKRGRTIEGFDMEKFWMHSIACGAASQSLAKIVGFENKEECFIAGLVHDLGKVVLYQYLTEQFEQITSSIREHDGLFYDTELSLFEFTHQDVGGFLAEHWKLPTLLQNTIRYHHLPSPQHDNYMVTAIVHCADIFVRALDYGNGGDNKIPLISQRVWKDLEMEHINLLGFFENISDEIDKAMVFIQFT
jgi:HD-like signal output (HDOD) protein